MAGQVVNPSTKFEDPKAVRSRGMSPDRGCHWQCVYSHYACAVSRDLCIVGKFSRIFEILDPDLLIHYTTFMALRLRQMELCAKTMYGPVLKITQLSAHAQNHVSIERCHKSFTTIVLGENFGNLTTFMAISSHIFTAHAQKGLFMNFRLKFWHHHSIPRFEDVFCWFLYWISWMSAIFLLPV